MNWLRLWIRKLWKRKRKSNYVHISDIFKFYESYCHRNGLNTNDWRQFKQWTMDTSSLADKDIKYRFTCCYFPLFNRTQRFVPIAKLARDAYIQFAVELGLLSLLALVVYRRLLKNQCKVKSEKTNTKR